MKHTLVRAYWVLLFFAAWPAVANAVDYEDWLEQAKEYASKNCADSANYYLDKVLHEHLQKADTSAWSLGVAVVGRAYAKGETTLILGHYKHYLTVAKQLFGENHLTVADLHARLGDVYRKPAVGQLYESLKYFNEAIRIYESHQVENVLLGFIYHFSGNIYTRLGSYSKAVNYLQKSLSIRLNTGDSLRSAQVYNDLGIVHTDLGEYTKGLEYYELGARTLNGLIHSRKSSSLYATLLLNKADNLLKTADNGEVPSTLEPALKIYEELDDISGLNAAYQTMAQWFLSSGNREKGLQYLQRAVHYAKRKYGTHDREVAKVWIEIARYFQHEGQYALGLTYADSALASLVVGYEIEDGRGNPKPDELYAEPWLLITLETKASLLCDQYTSEKKDLLLRHAQSTYMLAVKAMNLLRDAYIYGEDKERLFSSYHAVFKGAVLTTVELAELHDDNSLYNEAFQLQQKSQSYSLLELYKGLNAQSALHIPDSLVEQERALKARLSELNLIVAGEPSAKPNEELVQVRSRFENLVAHLQNTYPTYFGLKYADENLNLSQVQESIMSDEDVLIQYSLHEQQLICFLATKWHFKVVTVPIASSFFKNLEAYNALLVNPNFDQALDLSISEMANLGNALYKKLLGPLMDIIDDDQKAIKRLIIVPDGILNYLPFETLISEPYSSEAGFADLAFLIKNYSVAYAYSVSTLLHQQKMGGNAEHSLNIQAFAPQFEGALSLDHNTRELANIEELITGSFHYDSGINKRLFMEQMGTAKVLHLATHAFLNDSFPLRSHLLLGNSVGDANQQMYAYELYDLPIKADLVVLSACNTGQGQWQDGEGIISLSRGFAHAQCRSMVMSLWRVNDFATASLMKHFYAHLKDGQTKDMALREAKVHFLEENKGLKGHPYFWAGFVLKGNHKAIYFNNPSWFKNYWLYGLILLILIAFGIWFFIRRST